MKFGDFEITAHIFGYFRLDGGAMFGSVPKNIWSKSIAADEENCIRLAMRSLVIRHEGRVFLIDTGIGEKWSDKYRKIFAIDNTPADKLGFKPEQVTDLILTHLHFDHAGGVSRLNEDGTLSLVYPSARHYLQRANLENAKNPSLKERASYLKENVEPLEQAELVLLEGTNEIYPGITVYQIDGHTRGQQMVEIRSEDQAMIFPTDLIPTSHHLPVPFHMGYDNCAETVLKEKSELLKRALDENMLIVFEHDADVEAARITVNDRGHYAVKEQVSLAG
ncbi:MAG: MBL fold metallo-hydrolase [Candidatus Dadabacteria bacterium]|nr:MAG: MBL fold metallo-hydrolase [Candidatus Dadabacteria bacterium]